MRRRRILNTCYILGNNFCSRVHKHPKQTLYFTIFAVVSYNIDQVLYKLRSLYVMWSTAWEVGRTSPYGAPENGIFTSCLEF